MSAVALVLVLVLVMALSPVVASGLVVVGTLVRGGATGMRSLILGDGRVRPREQHHDHRAYQERDTSHEPSSQS
jgi:hypothetical protein